MLTAIRVPMIVRSQNPDARHGPPQAVILADSIVEFDLPELDAGSLISAFRFSGGNVSGEFVHDEETGDLFERCMPATSARAVAARVTPAKSPLRFLYEDIHGQYLNMRSLNPYVMHPGSLASDRTLSHQDFTDIGRIARLPETIADIAQWTGHAKAYLEGCVVMDGSVWKRVEEPLFELRKVAGLGWRARPFNQLSATPDAGSMIFSVDELDDMAAFQKREAARSGSEIRPIDLEIGSYVAKRKGCLLDVANMARFMIGLVNAANAKVGVERLSLANAPSAFVLGYGRLRTFLDIPEDARTVGDGDEAVDAMVAMSASVKGTARRRILPTEREVLLHADRWNDRTIRLDDVVFGY